MNTKLWAIVGAITLLGVSTTILVQSHKKPLPTVEDFKLCVMKNLNDCSEIKDGTEKKKCQSAESYLSNLSSSACSSFSDFIENSHKDEELNVNQYFQQCFLDKEVSQKIASLSSFYFNKIYTPVYKTCLGF